MSDEARVPTSLTLTLCWMVNVLPKLTLLRGSNFWDMSTSCTRSGSLFRPFSPSSLFGTLSPEYMIACSFGSTPGLVVARPPYVVMQLRSISQDVHMVTCSYVHALGPVMSLFRFNDDEAADLSVSPFTILNQADSRGARWSCCSRVFDVEHGEDLYTSA